MDRRFKNNYPSKDWLKSFVSRHSLTFRRANNVKPARAEVDADMVNNFFDELEQTIGGVPAANVYNYDETNVSDDPGAKIVVTHRGLKRVERKIQHSKTCISLMYCGNAVGQFLPPMVVHKSQNCYNESTIGGPKGTLYDNTLSGWFDSRCFEPRVPRHVFHVKLTSTRIGITASSLNSNRLPRNTCQLHPRVWQVNNFSAQQVNCMQIGEATCWARTPKNCFS